MATFTLNKFATHIGKDEKGNTFFLHVACGRRSYNSNDIKFGYCAVCHSFPEQQERHEALKTAMKIAEKNHKKRYGVY